ncbi:hypothetical protein VP01_358g6 [Puccinia sorghi]|uniref:Uncharacterized protein n=1 Tax=Puccinia sorghi TaxID=27349 RepID=A0A0L6UV61_9BASI|nr:hypothetical protein VP01_358g6 [Puccinia sorghi]
MHTVMRKNKLACAKNRDARWPNCGKIKNGNLNLNVEVSSEDYENAMTYLEDAKNYTALFGDAAKTSIGVKQMTKAQAFEVFATWLNQLNAGLMLNG